MKNKRLFRENGTEAGLYDVCEWWIDTYPDDIFLASPEHVVTARESMKKILAMRKSK